MLGIPEQLTETLSTHDEIDVAYVFGSTVRGTTSPLSDVDVGVLPAEGVDLTLRGRARLAEALTRAIDGRPVQVVLLNESAPALAARVVREGRVLLCRDRARRVRFEIRTVERDLDTVQLRVIFAGTLRRLIRDGRFYG